METFSALLVICAGNSPVPGEFPAQRPVTQNFDVFFALRLNKRLRKQMWGWWFETLSRPLWRHCNAYTELTQWQDHLVNHNILNDCLAASQSEYWWHPRLDWFLPVETTGRIHPVVMIHLVETSKQEMIRNLCFSSLIARFMWPTWCPSGADRTQVDPMLATWTLLSGISSCSCLCPIHSRMKM